MSASKRPKLASDKLQPQNIITAVIDLVLTHERHLFDDLELTLLELYPTLDAASRHLHYRLLQRTFKWELLSKLSVTLESISNLNLFAEIVKVNGLESLADWLALLSRDNLAELCKQERLDYNGRQKAVLIKSICTIALDNNIGFSPRGKQILAQVKLLVGPIIKLDDKIRDLFHRVFVVYYRSTRWPEDGKFLVDIILANSGPSVSGPNQEEEFLANRFYQDYKVSRISIVWNDRSDVIEYVDALFLEHSIRQLEKTKSWLEIIARTEDALDTWRRLVEQKATHISELPWLQKYTLGWVLTRTLQSRYESLLQSKQTDNAISLLKELIGQNFYCQQNRGAWYDDCAKHLEKQNQKSARQVCKEALSDTMVMTGHRFSISERLLRLNRSFQTVPSVLWDWKPQKIEVFNFKAERISAAAGKVMYKWKDGRVGAEEMALKYYEEQGWKGRHAENSTMQTIFGLLFWDIIFDDTVPGVFATPYQSQPLDMATPSFFLDRRKDIEKRLKEIKRGDYGILDKAEEGVRCTGVSWELFTKQDILEILQGLKGPSVEQICRMFAKSYRAYRGGAPDLILWNGTESKFVEVKSENDVLSDSQKAWMETLVGVGVNGSVFQII